jgi:hypothetical protein
MKSSSLCNVKNCKKPIHVQRQRLCLGHYQRLRRLGNVLAEIPLRHKSPRKEVPIWDANESK